MNEENMYADDDWSYAAAHFGLYGNEGAGGGSQQVIKEEKGPLQTKDIQQKKKRQ
ncbi:hypothetical protein BsIDN1_68430 [Bacillus safensis]|uniref:Uncharacterized protein n=1 Tax=Bacillus safensis TaxID=561879 RepID=A0A5S9MKC3_BACIA|nr:hypothetical protein BsIDN1_68430 [Bacillus safensis]